MFAAMDLRTDTIDPGLDLEIAPCLRRVVDSPLDPLLGFGDNEVIERALDLPSITSDATRQMRATLVANLLVAYVAARDQWVFYSRDRSYYSTPTVRRYAPPWYTYRNVLNAVADLEAAGLITHDRTAPSAAAKFRSRLRSTTDFAIRLDQLHAGNLIRIPHQLLVLRDRRKVRSDYVETRQISRQLVKATGPQLGRDYGFTFSDLMQRLLPAIVLDAYPSRPVTGARAAEIAASILPTPPFKEQNQ